MRNILSDTIKPFEYPDHYVDKVFYAWYENNRRLNPKLMRDIPDFPEGSGNKPNVATLNIWVKKFDWDIRAQGLEDELSKRMDDEIINKRMEMFKKHQEIGGALIEKGIEFLKENGITNDQAAIRAIDLGINIERVSTGMAESYLKISKMSDEELQRELLKLTGKKPDNDEEIIDAEVE